MNINNSPKFLSLLVLLGNLKKKSIEIFNFKENNFKKIKISIWLMVYSFRDKSILKYKCMSLPSSR